MNTLPLDLQSLIGELNGRSPKWHGLHDGTKMGHIHLHIRNVDEAEQFYSDILGFDRMMRYGPSASFVSAGGYHHHIGLNTWAGAGAPPPPAGSAGLRSYEIILPTQTALETVAHRLQENGVAYGKQDGRITLQDPSKNNLLLKVQTS
jgi:catechol 2,3-dioxygenase